jgi:hypothetical protein
MYRDSANYKIHKNVILEGSLLLEDMNPYLHEKEFFIPSEVGLPDLQPEPLTVYDHIWHEILAIEETSKPSNCALNAQELIKRFATAKSLNWNEGRVLERMNTI